MLDPINVKATTLSDVWFQLIYKCVEHGKKFVIDRGSFEGQTRLEFDYVTIHITHPDTIPLLPKLNPNLSIPDPVSEDYLDDYLPYLMTGEEKEGESYTYGQRLCAGILTNQHLQWQTVNGQQIYIQDQKIWDDLYHGDVIHINNGRHVLNQLELMIWTYKNKGYRNNQMCLQIAKPTDMLLQDPPCLRYIDTRIQDGMLHFFPYFRSWDLFSGLPANLAAIELMKQYCADQIGVENGEIIASSKGLHLYDYVIELAELIRGKTIEEFKAEQSK